MDSTGYILWSSAGGLAGAVIIWAVFATIIVRALHAGSSRALAVPADKRVVNWQHVADMEQDIYGQVFHHEDVPCCCPACRPVPARTFPAEREERVARAQERAARKRPAADPRPGTRQWEEAYERGRREMQEKLAADDRQPRTGVPRRPATLMTANPAELNNPVEVTSILDTERWYVEGSPS